MATIGELIINLNANTASFVTDLNRVKNLSFDTATQIQRSFSLIGTAALGMLGAFAGAMVAMTDRTTEFETHILHLAEASGMTVESMSGLAFVAKMFGLEVDQVASALEKFDKQLIAAQLGNKKAEQNMSLLGIDPATIKTSDEALMKLSAHFSQMPDGILKTGEAMLAFSKNGAVMLEMLNQGPVALQKYLDLARSLGLVFDKEDAEAALHFKQNLEILQGSFEGFRIQLEKAILPNLNELTDILVQERMEAPKTGGAIDALKFGFQVMASAAVITIQVLSLFGSAMHELGDLVVLYSKVIVEGFSAVGSAATGNFAEAHRAFQAMTDDFALAGIAAQAAAARELAIGVDANQRLTAIWGEGTKATTAAQKALDSLSATVKDKAAKAFEALQKSVDGMITSLKTQIATLGMSQEQVQEYNMRTAAAALGQGAWAEAEIALYRQLQTKLTVMQQIAKIDNETTQASKIRFLEDRNALELADIATLQKQLDIEMQLDTSKFSPTSNIGAITQTQAFTDAITQQTAAVEHSLATWGMSADEITRYDLAQLDSSVSAQKLTDKLIAERQQLEQMNSSAARSAMAWQEFGRVADTSLNDLIFSGKKFTQVLSDITKQLGEMFLKWALFGFGSNGKSSTGGGLFGMLAGGLSGLFGGLGGDGFSAAENAFLDTGVGFGFAAGGPVDANVPILVGENGPEIFRPSTAGAIIPNGVSAGGQVQIVYQIDARGSSITEEQFRRSLQLVEGRAVQRAIQTGREAQLRTA